MAALFRMVLWVCIQKVFHSATFRDWTGKGGHLLSEGGLRSRGPPPVMTRGEHPFICLPPLPPERYPVLCPRMETAGTDSGGGATQRELGTPEGRNSSG